MIYRDPQSQEWQTADAYLSGNVRAKLAAAEAAGADYARNADALRKVQPEDVLPGDIDANLGTPWIPESDIQAFAATLFQVEPNAIQVSHLKKDAVWSIDAGYSAEQSVAAKSDYGTPRINGTTLLELALRASGRNEVYVSTTNLRQIRPQANWRKASWSSVPRSNRRRSRPKLCSQAIVRSTNQRYTPRPLPCSRLRSPMIGVMPSHRGHHPPDRPEVVAGISLAAAPVSPAEGLGLPPTGGMLVRTSNTCVTSLTLPPAAVTVAASGMPWASVST